jgi:hypothetical protein
MKIGAVKILREVFIIMFAVLAGWSFVDHQFIWFSFDLACVIISVVQYVKGDY